MKTIAQTIEDACNNSSDALKMAGELGGEEDQDWDNETTTYTFKDKSRLVVSSMNFDAK